MSRKSGLCAFVPTSNVLGGCLFAFFPYPNAIHPGSSGSRNSPTPTNACTGIASRHLPWVRFGLLRDPSLLLPIALQCLLLRTTRQVQARSNAQSRKSGVRLDHLLLPRLPTTTRVSPFSSSQCWSPVALSLLPTVSPDHYARRGRPMTSLV
jgi:hypothetical protein